MADISAGESGVAAAAAGSRHPPRLWLLRRHEVLPLNCRHRQGVYSTHSGGHPGGNSEKRFRRLLSDTAVVNSIWGQTVTIIDGGREIGIVLTVRPVIGECCAQCVHRVADIFLSLRRIIPFYTRCSYSGVHVSATMLQQD